MSSAAIDSLQFATQQTAIYMGIFVLVSGLIGNTLNIIVFTSLKTFRETSCALYLTAASAVDLVQLLSLLLSRILISGYRIDLTQTSPFLCKLRLYIATTGTQLWFICLSLAAVDQFASLTHRWHHLSNTNVARRLVIFAILFCSLHDIPVAFFYNIYVSPTSNQRSCRITNPTFAVYYSQFIVLVLNGFLPLVIRVTFGLLSFLRVRSFVSRQVPIIRSQRDKQLTAMVLVEVVGDVLLTMPFVIYGIYDFNTVFADPVSIARDQLNFTVTSILFHAGGAASFYIYCCSSSRFRQQVIHVLINIHPKRCQERVAHLDNNRIVPQSTQKQEALAVVEDIELH